MCGAGDDNYSKVLANCNSTVCGGKLDEDLLITDERVVLFRNAMDKVVGFLDDY